MWILATVLGVLLFFALLLTVPVDLAFHVEKNLDFKSKVRVGWMFNLIGKDLRGKEKKPAEKKPEKKKKRNIKPFLAMLRTRGFLWRLGRLIRDVLRVLHVHELKADLHIGLGEPATTGMLFAVIAPAMAYIGASTTLDVQVQPDFEEASLQGYFKGDLRVLPIQLLAISILFFLSPATMRALKAMVVARRK